jgi:hypothetical protein
MTHIPSRSDQYSLLFFLSRWICFGVNVPPSETIILRFCLSIEVGALNGTIVQIGNPHVSPVNMAGLNVDYYAIGVSALGYDDLLVGAVSIQ